MIGRLEPTTDAVDKSDGREVARPAIVDSKSRRLARADHGRSAESLVIIGGGMTGFKLCERVLKFAGQSAFRITLIGDEPLPPYDRVNLHRQFTESDAASLQLASVDWFADRQIDLIVGDPAVLIERAERRVVLRSRRVVHYDRLVLATGSSAFVPPMEIAGRDRVLVYRTIADIDRMLELAESAESVAVIGGGMLGVEAARSLGELGLRATIVDYSTGLLARYLAPEAASLFNRQFAGLGIEILTNTVTERIEIAGTKRRLKFVGGGELVVDFVVVATGIRPRDELATHCGLELGHRGGVKVDDVLQTSDPHIFAIGECASHRNVVYGLAAPGLQMADVLATNLAGGRAKFSGAEQSCTLKLKECPVNVIGEYNFNGTAHVFSDRSHYRQLVFDGRRVVGGVIVGEWSELPRLREAIDSRRRIGRAQLNGFVKTGSLWPASGSELVISWPAGAVVCNCMGVSRGTLSDAIGKGCCTIASLAERTGASTVCGSCKPLLAQLVGASATETEARGWRWLLGAAGLSVVVAIAIGLIPALSPAVSVQGGWHFETLWRNAFWKQVTGFTMLGLIVFSLSLTLRKRIRKIRFGEFGWWRFMHAGLGLLSLLVLVTHTGFSLGKNLNFILMLNFLVLGAWGGLAGLVTSLEHRFSGYAGRRIRQSWTWLHIAFFWPLPALITFHIISVYWF